MDLDEADAFRNDTTGFRSDSDVSKRPSRQRTAVASEPHACDSFTSILSSASNKRSRDFATFLVLDTRDAIRH